MTESGTLLEMWAEYFRNLALSHTDDLRGPRQEVKKMGEESRGNEDQIFPSRLMRWHMVLQG